MTPQAPTFDPPPQPPPGPGDTVDFSLLVQKVRGLNLYLRTLLVWLTQQLGRVQWALRYSGIQINVPLAAGTVAQSFVAPFSIGVTATGAGAGILLADNFERTYTTDNPPGAQQYTFLAPDTVLLGSAAAAVRWQWVMEAA